MVLNLAEQYQLFAIVARYLQNLDKLTQDMTAGPHPERPWALKRARLWPLSYTSPAEELPAIVAFHRINRNFQTDSTNQRILQLLMHLPIHHP